jgi:hypothetical protein
MMTLETMEAEVRILKRELADLRRLVVRGGPLFDVVADDYGTWLRLNKQKFRLEEVVGIYGGNGIASLREVREALLERAKK